MNEKALATADFQVSGTGHNGEVNMTIHAELRESGAFDYGNGTCMIIKYSDSWMPDMVDTRYSDVTPETFGAFVLDYLKQNSVSTVTFTAI